MQTKIELTKEEFEEFSREVATFRIAKEQRDLAELKMRPLALLARMYMMRQNIPIGRLTGGIGASMEDDKYYMVADLSPEPTASESGQ